MMKSFKKIICLAVVIILVTLSATCAKKAVKIEAPQKPTYGAESALADDELTIDKMLQYAIQDEYLARSQFESIMQNFGEKIPFPTIMKSEEYHIAELKKLFITQTLDVSEDKSIEYVQKVDDFNQALQLSYDLELTNIEMYDKFLQMDLPDDIFATFTRLKNDSRAHSVEFEKNKK